MFAPRLLAVFTLLAAATTLLSAEEPRPAFPGAVGFGASTPGGRGGQIVRVTTLAARGAGSLAEALRTKGPRIVVFEVGGVIDLGGQSLKLAEPFVTIAGQTAPEPGITLIKGGLQIHTHDVILTHLHIRPGEAGKAKASGWEVDGMTTVAASQVLIDHCSFTWATDENASTSGPRFDGGDKAEDWRDHTSHDVTISNCIIAEGLSRSTHSKVEHSKGTLIHDNCTRISVIGNLYASNMERNPLAKGGVTAAIINNWIFNPGRRAIHSALVDKEWQGHPPEPIRLAIIGNLLEHGPNTPKDLPLYFHHYASPVEYFLRDNLAFRVDHSPAPQTGGQLSEPLAAEPAWLAGLKALPAEQVKASVAKNVGALPWRRDAIDERIVRDALAGQGKIIDSEQQGGGYPAPAPTQAAFKPEAWDLDTMQPRTLLR